MSPLDKDPNSALSHVLKAALAFYQAHAQEPGVGPTFGYFTRHPVAPLNRRRLGEMLTRIAARSNELKRPLRVLDLACGAGLITNAIALNGHRVLGLDASESEIRLAQQFTHEQTLPAYFWKADLLNDPTWEKRAEETLGGAVDVVVLAYALHHLPDVEGFVARLGRWLNDGALLIVNEENPHSPLFRLKHRVRTWIQRDTDVEWHRTYDGWRSLLVAQGFECERLRGLDPLRPLERQPLNCWSLVFEAVKKADQRVTPIPRTATG